MRNTILAVVILLPLLTGSALAQGAELPSPGILPGSPVFFLSRLVERVGDLFTFGEEAKMRRAIVLAEKRLAAAEVLAERGDERNVRLAVELYAERMEFAKRAAQNSQNTDALVRVSEATNRHVAIFDDVIERAPEQAKEPLRVAKERSVTGQIEALRALAERDPERAVEVFAEAAEGRLRAVQRLAERAVNQDTEAVAAVLEEYKKYAEFGKEISSMAEGISAGDTSVEDLVQRATSRHMEVLEDIRHKLPEETKEEYERAVDSTRRIQESRPLSSDRPDSDIFCTMEYNPVCGADGRTYGNRCIAEQQNKVRVAYEGECRPESGMVPPVRPEPSPTVPDPAPAVPSSQTYRVSSNEEGFSPRELKVRRGDTVIWVNTGNRTVWPASDPHPTHQLYPQFDSLRGIRSGESYTFVFERIGSWGYHDHLNPRAVGVVHVTE